MSECVYLVPLHRLSIMQCWGLCWQPYVLHTCSVASFTSCTSCCHLHRGLYPSCFLQAAVYEHFCVSSTTCQSRGTLQGKHAKCLLACCQGCVVTAHLLLGSIRVHHASVFLCCRVLDSIKDNLRKEQSTVMEFNFLTMNKILSPIQVRHPQAYRCPVLGLVHHSVLSCRHYFGSYSPVTVRTVLPKSCTCVRS